MKILLVKERTIKVVAKGTGSMPAPSGSSGSIHALLQIDDARFCAEAIPGHLVEVPGKLLKTTGNAPAACATLCVFGVDSDGDRLDDCLETNTGVFVDGFDTGTNPNAADTDGDEIADGDEVLLTTTGLDLTALGVNPLRRDILVEYDWFDDALECSSHTHQPTQVALDLVSATFDAAPVVNPDGSTASTSFTTAVRAAPSVAAT